MHLLGIRVDSGLFNWQHGDRSDPEGTYPQPKYNCKTAGADGEQRNVRPELPLREMWVRQEGHC